MSTTESTIHEVVRRGRRLEYLTLGWNLGEAAVAIGAGVVAGSISLLGFGIDSLIESLSGAVLLWRLAHGEKGEERERTASHSRPEEHPRYIVRHARAPKADFEMA